MTFHVGQKVVCVDDKPRDDWRPTFLKKGSIYTITWVYCVPAGSGVLLYEVENPYPDRLGWYSDRFRPIEERKTDITVFQKMLTPKKLEAVE